MVDVTPDDTPDEVGQLVEKAFFETYSDELDAAVISEDSLRALARAAAAVGARTALEDAAILARLREFAPTTIRILEAASRAATYTTDEETTA